MALKDDAEPLAYEIAFALSDDEPDLRERERLALDTGRKLRALAAMVLLTRADVARFRGNLVAAAELWRDYLIEAAAAPDLRTAGRAFARGRCEGLLDALAGGALVLARQIARTLPSEWRRECEYEDDFCWHAALALVLEGQVAAGALGNALMARFEACLQGQPAARLELARCLLARDRPAFGPAFEALLAEHAAGIDRRIEAGEMDDAVVLAERGLFVEGLAVLALAGALGLPSDREYLYCPSIARVAIGNF